MQWKGTERAWWGSNLPNNVGARPNVAVEEGQARVGNEIGEAHVCRNELCVWKERIEELWLKEESKFFYSLGLGGDCFRTHGPALVRPRPQSRGTVHPAPITARGLLCTCAISALVASASYFHPARGILSVALVPPLAWRAARRRRRSSNHRAFSPTPELAPSVDEYICHLPLPPN
jgi:hypothetical protein